MAAKGDRGATDAERERETGFWCWRHPTGEAIRGKGP